MRIAACLLVAVVCSGAVAADCPDLKSYKLGTPVKEIISANPKLKLKPVSKGNDLYRREHLGKKSAATIYLPKLTWYNPTKFHLVTDARDGIVVEIVTTIESDPDDVYNSLVVKFGTPTTQSYGPSGGRGDHLGEHDIDAFWTLACGAKVVFHGAGEDRFSSPVSRIRYSVEGFRKDLLD
jgi:hypothetical protein